MQTSSFSRVLALFVASIAGVAVACVGDAPVSPPGDGGSCAPKSCKVQGFDCGAQDDGCGHALDCGTCEGGPCTAGKCACTPKTCPAVGAQCGKIPDGCGGILDCGACGNASDSCNAQTNKCECKPKDCQAQGAECGTVADGCGGTYQCGTCSGNPAGPNCNAGKCGPTPCTPKKCVDLGKNCGQVSDGCGGILDCGTCTAPQSCGGSAIPNVCGCTAKTCLQLGKNCGSVPDGCGGSLSCGTCIAPDSCGGGGLPNQCGCTTRLCKQAECGIVNDGCGGTMDCGTCTCFTSGTPVLMADGGLRPIESVHKGDIILGYDEATGKVAPRTVDALAVHGAEESARGLVIVNDTIRATPNHPFWVGGKRVLAGDLKVGDVIRTATVDGHAGVTLKDEPVTSVSRVQAAVPSYDVTTVPPSGYFVGARHVLVLIKVPQ